MTLPLWATPFTDGVSQITAAFLNGYVRTQIPKAVDGAAGGAYNNSAALQWGGSAGHEFTCPVKFKSGAAPEIQSGVTATLKSGGTISTESGSTIARAGAETLSGVGATTAWRTANGADADGTYDVTYDEIRVPGTLTTATTKYTLRHSTAPVPAAGMRIRFSRLDASYTNTWQAIREDLTLLVTLPSSGASWVEVCYMLAPGDATLKWRVVQWGGNANVVNVL